jgi:hypothetical protein
MQLRSIFMVALAAFLLFAVSGFAQDDGNFAVRYASNLNTNDAITNMTDTGASWGETIPESFGSVRSNGNICVNIYVFSGDEQLQWCCQCILTPNALGAFSLLELEPLLLTNVFQRGLVVKLIASDQGPAFSSGGASIGTVNGCDATQFNRTSPGAFFPDPVGPTIEGANTSKGLIAWMRNNGTETAYGHGTLSYGATTVGNGFNGNIVGELAHNSALCAFNKINGSGFGFCNTKSFPGGAGALCPNRGGL